VDYTDRVVLGLWGQVSPAPTGSPVEIAAPHESDALQPRAAVLSQGACAPRWERSGGLHSRLQSLFFRSFVVRTMAHLPSLFVNPPGQSLVVVAFTDGAHSFLFLPPAKYSAARVGFSRSCCAEGRWGFAYLTNSWNFSSHSTSHASLLSSNERRCFFFFFVFFEPLRPTTNVARQLGQT
jgi:hypothetical protein